MNICSDFLPLVDQAVSEIERLSGLLKFKLNNIKDFFKLSQPITEQRPKGEIQFSIMINITSIPHLPEK